MINPAGGCAQQDLNLHELIFMQNFASVFKNAHCVNLQVMSSCEYGDFDTKDLKQKLDSYS